MADDAGAPLAQVPPVEVGQPLLQGDGSIEEPPSDSEADVQGSSTTTTSSTVGTTPLDVQQLDELQLPENDSNDQATTPELPSPQPSSTLTSLGQDQPQALPCPNNGLSAGAALVALPSSGGEKGEGQEEESQCHDEHQGSAVLDEPPEADSPESPSLTTDILTPPALAQFEDVPSPYMPRRGRPRLSIDTKLVRRTTNERRTSMLHSALDDAPAARDGRGGVLTLNTSVAAPPSVTVASVTPLPTSLALAAQEDDQRAYPINDHDDNNDALPNLIPISRVLLVTPLKLAVGSPTFTHSQGGAEFYNGNKDDEDDDEHLGADFLNTPYKPPSIQRALLHREAVIFHKGHAPLCGDAASRKQIHLSDLGIGLRLHFNFLRVLIVSFALLLVLNLPALVLYSSGSRIKEEQQDLLGLYALTLGNLGSVDFLSSSRWLTVRFFGPDGRIVGRIRLDDAAVLLAALDALSCLVFAGMIWYLGRMVQHAKKHQSKTILSSKDFTVHVTNLPPNVQKEDLIDHFSALYPLEGADWKGRAPSATGPPKLPVSDLVHVGGDERYSGKWVAEVTLAQKNGRELHRFLTHGDKALELKRLRAYLKKYRPAAGHVPGPAYSRAERRLAQLEKDMAAIAYSLRKNARRSEAEQECVGAFVLFEYLESAERCLQDYNSPNLFARWCVTQPLLFQGRYRLVVRPAPAPDDVIWENLQSSNWTRFARRQVVNMLTMMLLVFSFVVAVGVTNAKTEQSRHILKFSLCEAEIPALFVGGFSNLKSITAASGPLSFVSPTPDECPTCSTQCLGALAGGSVGADGSNIVYARYSSSSAVVAEELGNLTVSSSSSAGVGPFYSLSACQEQDNPCPRPWRINQCPCLLAAPRPGQRMPVCQTMACFTAANDTTIMTAPTNNTTGPKPICQRFPYSTVTACYCYARMTNLAKSYNWVSSVLLSLGDQSHAVCVAVARAIFVNVLLQLLLAACTLFVNALLVWVIAQLTVFELHVSADVEASQLMIRVFVSQFINMALLLLLVYGGYDHSSGGRQPAVWKWTQKALRTLGIFSGEYHDTTAQWYANVGVQLQLTALIAVFTPHIYPLSLYLVVGPVQRGLLWLGRAWRGSKAQPLHLLQQDLNSIYVGPLFNIVYRSGQLLTTVFFSLMYSSGLPILLLFALLTFMLCYGIDYLLLLRFYQRPPQRDERLHRQICRCLPYALLLHLSLAVWMMGNDRLLGSGHRLRIPQAAAAATAATPSGADLWPGQNLPSTSALDLPDYRLLATLVRRVSKDHTLPLFLLWVLVVVYVVVVDVLSLPSVSALLTQTRAMCYATVCATFGSARGSWAPRRQSRVGSYPICRVDVRRDNGYTKVFERPIPLDFNKEAPTVGSDTAIASSRSAPARFLLSPPGTPRTPGEGALGASWDAFIHDGTPVLRKLKSPRNSSSPRSGPSPSNRGGNSTRPSSANQQCKKTWEMLKQNGLWSYDLRCNIKYKEAVLTFMREFSQSPPSPVSYPSPRARSPSSAMV